jgi:signal transduction histidine kinase
MTKSIELTRKLKQEMVLVPLRMNCQVAQNFLGMSENTTVVTGEQFNEEESLQIIKEHDIADLGIFYTLKVMLSYIFNQHEDALVYAIKAQKFKGPLIGLFFLPLLYFYSSLAFLSKSALSQWPKRALFLSKVFFNQKTLKKWAVYAPENHLHKWYLVEAEKCRVIGSDSKAIKYYDEAILHARNNGFIHEEALANELAARYYLMKSNENKAGRYILEAHYLYSKWGAISKVKQFDLEYGDLLKTTSKEKTDNEDLTRTKLSGSSGTTVENIDLEALQKAAQTISSEIRLDKLLEKLVNILITNAGAEKGYIILKDNESLFVEGEASARIGKLQVLQHVPVKEAKEISQVVINYVLRTSELITLEDAVKEELFNYDEYIISNKPKSLFCMPLIYQNKLSGILYLENNLIPGAFTSGRVEMLKMLCGQIVISIENARLYKNLEEYNRNLEVKVEKRTTEISQKNEQLNIQKEELRATLENLKLSQVQLVQSEKMASLGQLVAGIAHEINNPVTYITAGVDSLKTNIEDVRKVLDIYHKITPGNVKSRLKEIDNLKEKVEYNQAIKEINKLIESIQNGTKRTTEIVKGLRTFSRLDEDILKMADIHEGLDSTLILLHNKYKNRIEIIKNYGDLPFVECYPGQLNQVFMNILANAIDAIEDSGTITITTSFENKIISIKISDTGKGIEENLKEKIFEPFYTTKEPGKGTGLGLSISHGIIEKHKGKISLRSEVGKGSEFVITLPAKQE